MLRRAFPTRFSPGRLRDDDNQGNNKNVTIPPSQMAADGQDAPLVVSSPPARASSPVLRALFPNNMQGTSPSPATTAITASASPPPTRASVNAVIEAQHLAYALSSVVNDVPLPPGRSDRPARALNYLRDTTDALLSAVEMLRSTLHTMISRVATPTPHKKRVQGSF